MASLDKDPRQSEILVYSKDYCPYCVAAKNLLTQKGVGYQEIDVTRDIIFKGITLHGVIGRRMYETWYQGTALIAERGLDLSEVITHELPLEEFEEGFAAMSEGRAGKVVLYP